MCAHDSSRRLDSASHFFRSFVRFYSIALFSSVCCSTKHLSRLEKWFRRYFHEHSTIASPNSHFAFHREKSRRNCRLNEFWKFAWRFFVAYRINDLPPFATVSAAPSSVESCCKLQSVTLTFRTHAVKRHVALSLNHGKRVLARHSHMHDNVRIWRRYRPFHARTHTHTHKYDRAATSRLPSHRERARARPCVCASLWMVHGRTQSNGTTQWLKSLAQPLWIVSSVWN